MSDARSLVFTALTTDSALNTLGIDANSVWSAGSLDGPLPGPFAVLRWGPVSKGFGPVNSATVSVYVHDSDSNYDTINAILSRMRAVMLSLCASGQAANWILEVEWLGDSGDLEDQQYKTLMRNADFRVVANTL